MSRPLRSLIALFLFAGALAAQPPPCQIETAPWSPTAAAVRAGGSSQIIHYVVSGEAAWQSAATFTWTPGAWPSGLTATFQPATTTRAVLTFAADLTVVPGTYPGARLAWTGTCSGIPATVLQIDIDVEVLPVPPVALTAEGSAGLATIPVGTAPELLLGGIPGAAYVWLFHADPGPTPVAGVTLPIGLSPGFWDQALGLPFPAAGYALWEPPVPPDPLLSGITLYSLAAFGHPASPLGFVASNRVDLRFFRHPDVPLKDRIGQPVSLGSTVPYSPRETCGGCHDVDAVANGYHFQQGRTDRSGAMVMRPDWFGDGRDWVQSPGMYGKW